MINFKAIIDEIPQPLWDSWYITEKVDSGVYSEVYKIEARRAGRTDYSLLKIQPIVIDDDVECDEEQKKFLLEKKYREVTDETATLYKLKSCPYVVGYQDERIIPLRFMHGYVLLTRMEYLMELPELVQKGGFPPTEENILKLAANIGRGLNAAHKLGIHHRDIKPSNFFAAPDGTFKLGDFNISGSKESVRTISGTAGYIAPEIYRSISTGGTEYTNKADIYSFGVCLYQLMNDFFFPFEEECSTEHAVERRMNGEPLQLPKNASADFGRIILKACAYDPAVRYNSMDELLCELENLRARRSIPAAPPSRTLPESGTVYAGPAEMRGYIPLPPPQPEKRDYSRQDNKKESRRSSKLVPVLILLLILAVIGILILLLGKDKDDDKKKKSSASSYELGDVDGDGVITESDSSLLLKEYALIGSKKSTFTEKQLEASDVDGDGAVTSIDATLLFRYCTYKTDTDDKDVLTLEEWIKENK